MNTRTALIGTAAVTATATQAGTVQIPLGNQATLEGANITSNTIGPLAPASPADFDLTGDGNADNILFQIAKSSNFSTVTTYALKFNINWATAAKAVWSKSGTLTSYVASITLASTTTGNGNNRTGLIPVKFTDSRINGGAETNALLEVNARHLSTTGKQITLTRLIFDDASTVQPTDATPGGTNPKWITPGERAAVAAQRSKLQREIKKKKRAVRRAKKAENRKKIRKLRKKIGNLRKRLRAL